MTPPPVPLPTAPALAPGEAPGEAPGLTHGCVRCGARIPLHESMCESCNPLGLKAPSASQAHGTVFVGIGVAVAIYRSKVESKELREMEAELAASSNAPLS